MPENTYNFYVENAEVERFMKKQSKFNSRTSWAIAICMGFIVYLAKRNKEQTKTIAELSKKTLNNKTEGE